ncbi:MAG: cytochrome C [Pseudomonadota bacterium]
MKMRTWLFLVLLMLLPLRANAIDLNLERMLSPGDLSQAHSKYEKDCKSCHSDFKQENQNALCVDCHKDVAQDISAKTGFHGRKPGIANSECRLCHSEHQGLKADIVQLNPHGFPHQFTDFPLQGLHQPVACNQCHVEGKKFREAPQQCVDCHRKDDVHKGSQGQQCANCHSAEGWRKTVFDHSKTLFPLKGAHSTVECSQCHRGSDYKQAETTCVSCHKIDDVHLNTFGTQCDSCHSTEKWKSVRFNHDRDTDFHLAGAHRTLQCSSCHKPGTLAKELPQTCVGCHRQNDVHFGKNGEQCDQCHSVNSWGKSRFDHSKTGFPLRGGHANAQCSQCHQGNVNTPIKDTTCVACHGADDVHNQSLGTQCQQCHSESGWHDNVQFDHELTHFPLLGMHATSACESCHENTRFAGTASACVDCHRTDDTHKGKLGDDCGSCHHPAAWKSWRFDHDKQTPFPLTGAHQGLACDGCHDQAFSQLKGQQCGQCHQADDVHRGAYGRQCDTCHDTRDFSTLEMR